MDGRLARHPDQLYVEVLSASRITIDAPMSRAFWLEGHSRYKWIKPAHRTHAALNGV
jgi:hypothetical protein